MSKEDSTQEKLIILEKKWIDYHGQLVVCEGAYYRGLRDALDRCIEDLQELLKESSSS